MSPGNGVNVTKTHKKMKNPTLLTLLKKGCKIEFPSGYILTGDPDNNYIDTGFELEGHYCGDGTRILDRDGVRLAINDEVHFKNTKNE